MGVAEICLEAMPENQPIEKVVIEDGKQSLTTQSFRFDIWKHRWVRITTYLATMDLKL